MVMIGFTLAVLVVIAHPDDETLFSGFLHALTHKLNASVDLVCITNGEGGFRHSAPSESLYGNLQLSNETIARQHLPRIRKQELLDSGKILGIRKYFFYDQFDLKYDRDVENVLSKQWNKELIIQLLEQTITTGNGQQGYNLMLIMLPSVQSHGHHTASGLLALETIKRLRDKQLDEMKLPIVIGGSEFVLSDRPIYTLNSLAETSAEFRFHRKWKLSSSSEISDYQMIVLWVCGEHKSQGGLIAETLTLLARDNEQYFYFTLNNNTQKLRMIDTLFKRLADMHDYDSGNML
ncbi:unnamed protein product [Adineta ricciae]|uniref:N-acetylglucosaminylphosphatidylinositol deacetylase n=1 Tax=Adineta ricciae TaxID=249248 RepID=A0A814X833_ADIRI|nr:unnamed protein product [Adineta ricciae]